LISITVFHFGVLLYVLAIVSFPKESQLAWSDDKKSLGVCSALARNLRMETALIRLITLLLLFGSLGLGLIAYLGVYFYLVSTDQLVGR